MSFFGEIGMFGAPHSGNNHLNAQIKHLNHLQSLPRTPHRDAQIQKLGAKIYAQQMKNIAATGYFGGPATLSPAQIQQNHQAVAAGYTVTYGHTLGALGARQTAAQRQAATAARKAAAQAKQVAKQEAAAAKQLSAAMAKANQTAAIQAKEAGLQAKLTALQSGATVKQAATAMKTATAAAKTQLKTAGASPTGAAAGAGTSPYTVTPPTTTPNATTGAGYNVTTPGIAPPGTVMGPTGMPIPIPGTMPMPSPVAGGYSGGGGMMMPPGGSGYAPPAGGYTIGPAAGGYAVGEPQGYTPAGTPMSVVSPQYGVYGSGTGVISPVIGGTAIGLTPGAAQYSIGAPGLPIGAAPGDPLANIAAYTTHEAGDTTACDRKRDALAKAYQKALQRMQKNPNAKALTTFEKQLPNKIKQLLKQCPAPAQWPYNQILQSCAIGMQRNPYTGACVAVGLQPNYPMYPQTPYPQAPMPYPQIPGGVGPQPGESVYMDGSYSAGGYAGGQGYAVVSGASAYTAAPQGGQYGPPPRGAVIGPVRDTGGYAGGAGGYMNASGGAGYADVPVQSEASFDAVDPNVLAMADTSAQGSGLDETDNQDQSVLAMSELPVGDTGSSFSGFAGFGRVGRPRGQRQGMRITRQKPHKRLRG
jgi:hypothetical protein